MNFSDVSGSLRFWRNILEAVKDPEIEFDGDIRIGKFNIGDACPICKSFESCQLCPLRDHYCQRNNGTVTRLRPVFADKDREAAAEILREKIDFLNQLLEGLMDECI